ncbi:MAG: T9SS type A sorting domain-containing protein [Chitinophagaceae bacterium]|nr:T9SS type A sorting domain-containing protein [Chitinophagaceae bacterium]
MSRIYTFLLALLIFSKWSVAQTTYTWVGTAVGDYQVSANWSPVRAIPAANDILAFNAAAPLTIANVPNQTIGAVRILTGTSSVTFTTNVVTNILSLSAATPLVYTTAGSIYAGDLLTIALTNTTAFPISSGTFGIAPSTGGKISINSAITLSGGTLDFDVIGTGGTTVNSGASITNSAGTFNSSSAAAITWAAGSNYYHAVNGTAASSIPVSFWAGGSTCNITGLNTGSIAPTGFTASSFSNLIWNCTAQAGDIDLNLLGVPATTSGTFTIASTGANALRLTGAGSSIINAGAYTQTGGTFVLQSSTGNTTLNVNGNFSHTGGTIDFAGSGASPSTATLSVKGSLTKGASSTWSSSSTSTASQMNIQFAGNSSQVVMIAGTWNSPGAGRCNIINNNTDAVGVSINSGTLKVVNTNSASPATCSNAGNFTGVGAIAYSGSGAGVNNFTLIYNGSITQTASGVEFPAASGPFNLTISSSVGISFPNSFSRTIAGTLTMVSGGIAIGPNTLSLTNANLANQLVYTAGYITSGTLSRRFPTTGLPTVPSADSRFPFGTGNNDRSINIYFTTPILTAGTGGDIAISHNAVINATAMGPFSDNGSTLDKRTNSSWAINTGTFNLGSGGTTISVTAQANNIGSVDDISTLRLTDAVAGFGTLIATTGSNDAPLVGKSGLVIADINTKTFYVGSDALNALQIVTFTWTGAVNTAWTNPANWTGAVGYPASQTEIAIINTVGGNMPVIGTGSAINLYQLTVGASATLSMTGSASISVYDLVTFSGTANFSGTSTFNYASSGASQNIVALPYVNLGLSGSAAKILPAITTVTGDFSTSGAAPTIGTGTFIYAAGTAAIQRVAATNYYNLTFSGNRGGNEIRLGNGVSNNTIDVANNFVVTATNYVANDFGYNTFNFSSTSLVVAQTIPGFTYGNITNTGNGLRIFDPLGSTNAANVITCRSLGNSIPLSNNTTTGSKVRLNRTSAGSTTLFGFQYHDFELTGDLAHTNVSVFGGQIISIAGTFSITATNFKQVATANTFNFNGTGDQTIPAFKTNTATNTPAWRFNNVTVTNGNRIITLGGAGTDTINITGTFTVPTAASFPVSKGFVVAGSTVNFIDGSGSIPVLTPVTIGGNNYNNLTVTGGSRIFGGDLIFGGNLAVVGSDASLATLNVGNASSNRTVTVMGNLSVTGTSSSSALTGTLDFNAGSTTTLINLAGNLSVSGTGQLTTTNGSTVSGYLLFNGTTPQYSNTSIFKNGFVNFIVGNGTAATTLTLNDKLELIRSGVAPFSSSLSVASNSILNAGTKNITVGTDDGNIGNDAVINLNGGATLITANTGIAPNTAIEGTATDGTTGTILAGTKITKNYNTGASYVLNGATVNPFPAAITTMANLTIGANVSLNKAIIATATLDLASFTLTQAGNNLQFSGLTSTTGNIYADKNSSLSISGSVGTVGALRFATGGNTTGQFTINRSVTVLLNSDLLIEKTPLTGDLITGTGTSILDINGNTLTINGSISGLGTLSGSNTSSLSLGGTAGTVNFTTGKRILKNLSLMGSATATLGTTLDITGGTLPGNEGTVSVAGSSVLTTSGNLTLKSNINGTARVAQGAVGGNYINGDVTIERFLPSVRAWRFLAAPTVGQTIKQSWQENQAAGVNPGTGYGTNITSNAGTWAADGFDFYTPGNSLLIYNATLNGWQGFPNTSSQIAVAGANKAYMLFSRGDRSVTPAVGTPPTAVLLRTKGVLFQGDLPAVPVTTAGQFAAIGNNYAAAIDFTALTKSNIDQSFSVWDPKIPGALGLGGWVTFSASTATPWVPVPGGGSYAVGVPNTRIESGQAFMVHSTTGSGSVILSESSKQTGSRLVLRPSGTNAVKSSITANLYNTNTGVANIADATVAVFSDDYSNAIDEKDAVKANNFGDNFGILNNAQTLVVDARPSVTATDTVFFNMKKIKLQSYRLELIAENFDNSITGFLEDRYLNTSVALNMTGTTTTDFSVTSDAASAIANRFRIVFKNLRPLPVTFTSITATKKVNGNEVEWDVEHEINISSYEVERSTNGTTFTKIGAAAAGSATYNWLDAYPVNGDNFYRIKSISNRGTYEYSRIVKVASVKGKTGFTVYPNPSTDGNIGLQMSNLPAGIYTVRLINNNGQVMCKELINHAGGTSTKAIHPASTMISGNYQVEVTDITGNITVIKVLVL